MRRKALQEQTALLERFPHQAKVELFKIADAAVHEFR